MDASAHSKKEPNSNSGSASNRDMFTKKANGKTFKKAPTKNNRKVYICTYIYKYHGHNKNKNNTANLSDWYDTNVLALGFVSTGQTNFPIRVIGKK